MGIGISHGFATLGTIEPIADVVDPVLGAERASRGELGRSETAVTLMVSTKFKIEENLLVLLARQTE